MRCLFDSSPADFLARTADFRNADPIRTNVITTLAIARSGGGVATEPGALWLRVEAQDGTVIGIGLRTPPRAILLSSMPLTAARLVADAVAADHARNLPGVDAPLDVATAFAEAYCAWTGATFALDLDQRMLALRVVIPPRPVHGAYRAAESTDRDTVVGWVNDFNAEALPGREPPPAADIERRIAQPETMWLWDVDGRPTSLCWQSALAAGVVRISAVYTPPEERGNGYASANVAAVSRRSLDRGADACVLYTDRTNATSNKVYEDIGYAWVADVMAYAFTAPADDLPASAPAS